MTKEELREEFRKNRGKMPDEDRRRLQKENQDRRREVEKMGGYDAIAKQSRLRDLSPDEADSIAAD